MPDTMPATMIDYLRDGEHQTLLCLAHFCVWHIPRTAFVPLPQTRSHPAWTGLPRWGLRNAPVQLSQGKLLFTMP